MHGEYSLFVQRYQKDSHSVNMALGMRHWNSQTQLNLAIKALEQSNQFSSPIVGKSRASGSHQCVANATYLWQMRTKFVINAKSMPFNVPSVAMQSVEPVHFALCVGMVSKRFMQLFFLAVPISHVDCIQSSHLDHIPGGHLDHMIQWFEKQSVCPTGCGCMCKLENTQRLQS